MRILSTLLLFLYVIVPAAHAQDDAAPEEPAKTEPAPEKNVEESELLTASSMRDRVRTMRKNVLVGGPAVVRSEKEALKFYRKKVNEVARRTDELRTQRDVKESEYDLALDTTLKAANDEEQQAAARTASKLRGEMAELDTEIALLERQGEGLGRAIGAIRKRMEQRKRLLSRFDRPEYAEELAYLGDGLLEMDDEEEGGDPFVDEAFINDLIKRDEAAARKLLFGTSTELYWKKFPLTPPRVALSRALRPPPADLPEQR